MTVVQGWPIAPDFWSIIEMVVLAVLESGSLGVIEESNWIHLSGMDAEVMICASWLWGNGLAEHLVNKNI